jgi:hypothetical protein
MERSGYVFVRMVHGSGGLDFVIIGEMVCLDVALDKTLTCKKVAEYSGHILDSEVRQVETTTHPRMELHAQARRCLIRRNGAGRYVQVRDKNVETLGSGDQMLMLMLIQKLLDLS